MAKRKKKESVQYNDILSINYAFEAIDELVEKVTDAQCIIPYELKENIKNESGISLSEVLKQIDEMLCPFYQKIVVQKNKFEKEYYQVK